MFSIFTTGKKIPQRDKRKLFKVMDIYVYCLDLVIISWVNAYVQTHQTVNTFKKRNSGLESSALLNDQYVFFN